MPMHELTRRCICHALIEDPAAAACEQCARPLVPHFSTWPATMKWWLLAELAGARFHAWLTDQQVFELLLRDALNGIRAGASSPNPNGVNITMSTPASELYPIALERAAAWKASGSPIGRPASATEMQRSA
jgi:hypothetical protein